jgi:hypothetical protein
MKDLMKIINVSVRISYTPTKILTSYIKLLYSGMYFSKEDILIVKLE